MSKGTGILGKLLVLSAAVAVMGGALVLAPAVVFATDPPPPPSCIEVTKECRDAATPADPIEYWGMVYNNCDYDIIEVRVKDYVDGVQVGVHGIGDMAAGTSASFSGSYYPSTSPSTDTVIAKSAYIDADGKVIYNFAEASATCKVSDDGGEGCTLTPGYWKTHSLMGPAPYDMTWGLLTDGAMTPFFLSGLSYYEVLWTPTKGNAYFILASQFIASQLNFMNGASSPSAVADVWSEARTIFETYTPEDINSLSKKDPLRKRVIGIGKMLDGYNNGLTGPGHCD